MALAVVAAVLLEVVGQPTVDPRQVSDRPLHLFEVKQHLDVLLDLGVRALLHQVLDALTVEEEEAADADAAGCSGSSPGARG